MSTNEEADERVPPEGGIARIDVGSSGPLAASAGLLLKHPVDDLGEIDLTSLMVVMPGRRAGRQLLVELEEQAIAIGRRIVPPRTTTPSGLAAAFADLGADQGGGRVADEETWLAAMTAALGDDANAGQDAGLLPSDAGALERRAMARRIIEADRIVRAGDRRWVEVIEAVIEMGGDDSRHRGIARVITEATRRLEDLGMTGPEDASDATIAAIDSTDQLRPDSPRRVVLLGVVDLTPRMRRLVATLASSGVTIEVHAAVDPSDADRLDRFGSVVPEAWDRDPPSPPVESILVEAGMLDEATALDEHVQGLSKPDETGTARIDPDSVAVVLADESRGPAVRRELQGRGIDVHLAAGLPLSATTVARTIERMRDWSDHPDTHRLGDLLGDVALGAAIRGDVGVGDPEAAWNVFAADRMPGPVSGEWWSGVRSPEDRIALEHVDASIRRLLGPFHPGEGIDATAATRTVSQWAVELFGLLDRLEVANDPGVFSMRSLQSVREIIGVLASIPREIDSLVTSASALEIIIEIISRTAVVDSSGPSALETIGWLESPFDPAPRRVVLGMHDAAVPGRIDDPILPDRLRSRMGLDDERRRTARDRWVLSTILARDPEAAFILSRRDLGGEPLVPSRLLFGVSAIPSGEAPGPITGPITGTEAEKLAKKVGHVFGPVSRRRGRGAASSSFGRFDPPGPGSCEVPAPAVLSVTAFRDYLASPYRFWLKRILRLDVRTPVGTELDPRLFGIVLHDAVEAFGRKEMDRGEAGHLPTTDLDVVHGEMLDGMQTSIARLTGGEEDGSAALRLQRRIIERRLRKVAEVEVRRRIDGWRIHAVEARFDVELDIPGEKSQPITGRIDRIDHHPLHGWQLLDFKTSDAGKSPDQVHHQRTTGAWFDLQLPLYRWAAPSILDGATPGSVGTGYFVVGADLDRIDVIESNRIDGLLDDAIETARHVVRAIRAGRFESSIDDAPPWEGDPVSLLMRTTALIADGGEEEA